MLRFFNGCLSHDAAFIELVTDPAYDALTHSQHTAQASQIEIDKP